MKMATQSTQGLVAKMKDAVYSKLMANLGEDERERKFD